jgi:hypothetical protein
LEVEGELSIRSSFEGKAKLTVTKDEESEDEEEE